MKRQRSNVAFLVLALAIAVLLGPGVQSAAGGESYLEGIDVSHWQGKPRWAEVKNAGIAFVIAKASSANSGRDAQYPRNRRLLRRNGIPFTAYHFAKPDVSAGDAVAEADNFVNAAALSGNNLVPVLDLESHGDLGVATLTEWVQAWLARVEARLSVKAMIYTSAAFWGERLGNSTWFADNGYRLWIRDWYVASPTLPAEEWGGLGWTLWQHGKAPVAGIQGKVDRNRLNGTNLDPLRIKNNR